MNIRPRDVALLGVAAAIALIAGFYVLLLKPEDRKAARLQHSIATAQGQLVSAQNAYAAGRAAQRQLTAADHDYAAAKRAIPAQTDVPALLRLLQHNADAVHVSISNVGLSGSGASGTSSSTPTTAGTTGTTGAATTPAAPQMVPVSLVFTGSYQALNRMVKRLDGLVSMNGGHLRASGPLVSIGNVALANAQSGSSSSGGAPSLSVTLTVTMYQTAATTSVTGPTSEGS